MRVYCPVPDERDVRRKMTARPERIEGLRVALLGNLKPNCDTLLHAAGAQLVAAGAREAVFREKASCSLGAPEAMLDDLAATCRIAVVGLGD